MSPPSPVPTSWVRGCLAVALVLAGLAAAVVLDTDQTVSILAAALVGALVVALWTDVAKLAWLAGLLLPMEVLDGADHPAMEAIAVAVVGLVALRSRPGLDPPAATVIRLLGALLLAMALTRLGFGLVRDPLLPTLRFVALSSAAVVAAMLLAASPRIHRPLLFGLLGGATLSAAVALLQAAGLDVLRTAPDVANRFPGLAVQVPGLSWHLVAALPVGLAAFVTSPPGLVRRAVGAQMVVCAGGLVVCGAQGGLVGLAFAAVLCVVFARGRIDRDMVVRRAPLALGAVAAVVVLALVSGLGAASVRGLVGDPDKGFTNEEARVRSIEHGVEQIVERPLVGLGYTAYDDRYDVRPHVLPLDLAVNTGVLGLVIGAGLVALLAWLVFRGPATPDPSGLLGVAILATMLVATLLTPAGPFADVERLSLLGIGAVLVMGGSRPFPGRSSASEATPTDARLRDPAP